MNKTSTLQNSLMLAPLIGASDTLLTALSLALLCVLVIAVYGLKMRLLRAWLSAPLHLPAGVLLAATLTSLAALATQAWALELHQHLGLYIGLIALQCVVLECNGFFTETRLLDRLRLCALFVSLMIGLGLLREVLGHGSISWHLPWLAADGSVRLAILAPGGFILLGLLLAARQAWLGRTPTP